MPKLSLVIPCFNEAKNLPLLLARCAALSGSGEVILVDNGSSDETSLVLEKLLPVYPGVRSVRVERNLGYGYGILSGLRSAGGEILGWTHADLQTDPQDVLSGLELFSTHGPDIFVKGRRYGRPVADVFFTMGMSFFETILLGRSLHDINAQPTLFSRKFFESWDNPPHDFSLDLFAYYQASRAGLAIHRFPVNFGKRAYGVSSWNVDLKSKVKFIRRTLNYSFELKKSLKKG